MLALAALISALSAPVQTMAAVADTTVARTSVITVLPTPDSGSLGDSAVVAPGRALSQAPTPSTADTVRRRRRAVEMSEGAELRLRIHRYASYTMIPLFVLQTVAGNQLYQADKSGAERPGWASSTHSAGAAGLGALFTVNTVTGLWSLWDSRANEQGRTRRWVHSLLMLGSDAGFTYAGIKLSSDAKNSQSGRDQHRKVAYVSMGAALTSYGIMFIGNR